MASVINGEQYVRFGAGANVDCSLFDTVEKCAEYIVIYGISHNFFNIQTEEQRNEIYDDILAYLQSKELNTETTEEVEVEEEIVSEDKDNNEEVQRGEE